MNNHFINKINPFWLILFLCGANLLVMHYSIIFANQLETDLELTSIADNLFGISLDICFLFLAFHFLTWKKGILTLTFCFVTTWLWSLSNVIYSRFFHYYISLSAIGQGDNLFDWEMIKCVLDGLHWYDLHYLLSLLVFCYLIRKVTIIKRPVSKALLLLAVMIGIEFTSWIIYYSLVPERRYMSLIIRRVQHRHLSNSFYMCNPINSTFRRGSIRTLFREIRLELQGRMDITAEQRNMINEVINKTKSTLSDASISDSYQNVVFIIVESYMSFTSDMIVNGREVTPFLNSLKSDSTVYYNGNMHENVTIGESADGQFIYMTGMLPLRSVITISKAKKAPQPGLPKKLGRESRMIIPTPSYLWNQDIMCQQYGFNTLYASNDYADGQISYLTDEQVFQLAMQKDETSMQPFFSVILTMSMHQPYTEQIDPSFPITDNSLPNDLACYLNACHYTDHQIEIYFNHLKSLGLFDHTFIVIAADHPVHNTDFGGMKKDIPLYLINIPQNIKEELWSGECNQLDVYTTLMDLLDIESDWYGLGHSLLSPTYDWHINSNKWDISEWLIRGEYFSL